MGMLINGKRHGVRELCAVLAITAGIMLFSFGKSGKDGAQADHTGLGLLLVFLNLCCDGFTNATQDKMVKAYAVPYLQLMLYMNVPSCAMLLLFLFNPHSSSGMAAVAYILENRSLIVDILAFSVCGAVGQNFIFYTIKEFGSLTCQTITLTRKACQIFLSVIFFGHSIAPLQWCGCAVVFSGLALELHTKETSKRKAAAEKAALENSKKTK